MLCWLSEARVQAGRTASPGEPLFWERPWALAELSTGQLAALLLFINPLSQRDKPGFTGALVWTYWELQCSNNMRAQCFYFLTETPPPKLFCDCKVDRLDKCGIGLGILQCRKTMRIPPCAVESVIIIKGSICLLLVVGGLNQITSLSGTVSSCVHWNFHKRFHLSFLIFSSTILSTFNCFPGHGFIFSQFEILNTVRKITRMPFVMAHLWVFL